MTNQPIAPMTADEIREADRLYALSQDAYYVEDKHKAARDFAREFGFRLINTIHLLNATIKQRDEEIARLKAKVVKALLGEGWVSIERKNHKSPMEKK
jgi:hypothetical protein